MTEKTQRCLKRVKYWTRRDLTTRAAWFEQRVGALTEMLAADALPEKVKGFLVEELERSRCRLDDAHRMLDELGNAP